MKPRVLASSIEKVVNDAQQTPKRSGFRPWATSCATTGDCMGDNERTAGTSAKTYAR